MNHRITTLLARTDYDADKTESIDLDVIDPISMILIKFELLYGSVTQVAHPLACITKIELVDGSEVIFSLNGREADALDWYHSGFRFKDNYNYACTSGTPQRYLAINFGRYLWDKELAFDPKKFRNPQLRITLDIDAADASCAHNYLTVWACVFDEQTIVPTGFLMHKEIKDYALGASSHEYTDLPTDYPYRALLLRCQYNDVEPINLINNVKLSEDMDKRVIFDDQPSLVQMQLNPTVPQVKEEYWFSLNTSARYLFIAPTTRVKADGAVWLAAGAAQHASFYSGDGGYLLTIADANPSNTQIFVAGSLPHGVWHYPFGDQMNINEWYDVAKVGALRLDVEATGSASASHAAQIFLQQMKKY